jgi:hypothetical protein
MGITDMTIPAGSGAACVRLQKAELRPDRENLRVATGIS